MYIARVAFPFKRRHPRPLGSRGPAITRRREGKRRESLYESEVSMLASECNPRSDAQSSTEPSECAFQGEGRPLGPRCA